MFNQAVQFRTRPRTVSRDERIRNLFQVNTTIFPPAAFASVQQTGLTGWHRLHKKRLRSLKDLDTAALMLRDDVRIILDSSL
jgi:hypothetical protein